MDSKNLKACGCGLGYCSHNNNLQNNPRISNRYGSNVLLTLLVVLALFSVAISKHSQK
jgi:hypothetical protein